MIFKYTAPTLTKYGKVTEFIEAGSVALITGDVTGDGVPDTLFDTDGDGSGDLVVGGANGGQTPVREIEIPGFGLLGVYDADGDGRGGIIEGNGGLERVQVNSSISELAETDGWDNPARD